MATAMTIIAEGLARLNKIIPKCTPVPKEIQGMSNLTFQLVTALSYFDSKNTTVNFLIELMADVRVSDIESTLERLKSLAFLKIEGDRVLITSSLQEKMRTRLRSDTSLSTTESMVQLTTKLLTMFYWNYVTLRGDTALIKEWLAHAMKLFPYQVENLAVIVDPAVIRYLDRLCFHLLANGQYFECAAVAEKLAFIYSQLALGLEQDDKVTSEMELWAADAHYNLGNCEKALSLVNSVLDRQMTTHADTDWQSRHAFMLKAKIHEIRLDGQHRLESIKIYDELIEDGKGSKSRWPFNSLCYTLGKAVALALSGQMQQAAELIIGVYQDAEEEYGVSRWIADMTENRLGLTAYRKETLVKIRGSGVYSYAYEVSLQFLGVLHPVTVAFKNELVTLYYL